MRHPWKGSIAPVVPIASMVLVMSAYEASRNKAMEALTKGLMECELKGNLCRANIEQLQPAWLSSTSVEQPKILFLSLLCFNSATNGKHAFVSRFGRLHFLSFSSVYHLRKSPFLLKDLQYLFLSKTKRSFYRSWQRGPVVICPF